MNRKEQKFLRNFLLILKKEKCAKTKEKLCTHFGFFPSREKEIKSAKKIKSAYMNGELDEKSLKKALDQHYSIHFSKPRELSATFVVFTLPAIEKIYDKQRRDEVENLQEYKKFKKKIDKLENAINDLHQYVKKNDDRQVIYKKNLSDELDSGRAQKRREKIIESLEFLNLELSLFADDSKKMPGRSSLEEFYEFVLHIANLYQELSGKKIYC